MEDTNKEKCFFSGRPARVVSLSNYDGVSVSIDAVGEYWITRQAYLSYRHSDSLSELARHLCLQETVNLNREGLIPFWTISEDDERLQNAPNVVLRAIESMKDKTIEHKDKEKKILELLARKLSASLNPFQWIRLDLADRYSIGIFDNDEYVDWLIYLTKNSLVELSDECMAASRDKSLHGTLLKLVTQSDCIKLTVQGWEAVRKFNLATKSKAVFVAMAFTDKEGNKLQPETRDTIKQTLERLSWKPVIVDEVEHNDGIMDKVIASINEAHFVIAELTHQKSGVYYEAGYAKGRGLPVIHIVRAIDLSSCHFDVKHLNLIVWETTADLSLKLESRIKATII